MLKLATAGLETDNPLPRDGHRLWSLWEMVNFFFGSVRHMLSELTILITVSNQNMKSAEAMDLNNPKVAKAVDDCVETAGKLAQASKNLFADLKCVHTDDAARRIGSNSLKDSFTWAELNTRPRALTDAVQAELNQYFYYQYPKQKGEKLRSWKDDWKKPCAAFPDVERDVFDATDCYGLQHNTASVFHSMRIAEHGLRALAKERKIKLAKNKPIEWGTWQEIIKALDDEIKIIGSKKAGAPKDGALEFYSGARADLNGFKDEYRNLVMHVRATYDEHQALRALTNVHAFMERIAAKIDRKHHRIRWGFR